MAWTGLKKRVPSPHAHSSAGGGAAAQKTRWGQSSQEKASASSPDKNASRRARFWVSVLAVPAMYMAGAGMAHADTDILINQEACAIGAGGATTASCPNSLDGPAGGNVRFTAKVIWNTGDGPGVVTLVDKLTSCQLGRFLSRSMAPLVRALLLPAQLLMPATKPSLAPCRLSLAWATPMPSVSISW